MRKHLFLLFTACLLLNVLSAQDGTIIVEKPDTAKPQPLPRVPPLFRIGLEHYNGIEHIGQYFTPWRANRDSLMLYNGFGLTLSVKRSIPLKGNSGLIYFGLVTGISAFRYSDGKIWSSPAAMLKVGYSPFDNVYITGIAGGRVFYNARNIHYSGSLRPEVGIGLGFNMYRIFYPRSAKIFQPNCWPFVEVQYRLIERRPYTYFQVELPLPQLRQRNTWIPVNSDPLNR
jgi:hypothetical protein